MGAREGLLSMYRRYLQSQKSWQVITNKSKVCRQSSVWIGCGEVGVEALPRSGLLTATTLITDDFTAAIAVVRDYSTM